MDEELKKELIGTYCSCYNVSYDEIAGIVKNMDITSIRELQNYVVVCKKCLRCSRDIKKIIEYYRNT